MNKRKGEKGKLYQYRPVLVVAVGAAAVAGSGSALEAFPVLLSLPVHPPGLLDDSLRQHPVAGGDQVSGPIHHLLNGLQIAIDAHHLHRVDDIHSVCSLEPGRHTCDCRPQPAEVLQQPPLVRVVLKTVQFFYPYHSKGSKTWA